MSRREERLDAILTIVRNIKKKAIVSRKKTGWFDKENALNRVTTAIERVHRLGVSTRLKKPALVNCWKVYMDLQSMAGPDGVREQPKIPISAIVKFFEEGEKKIDKHSPAMYSGGLGYAHVNWTYVYVDQKATSNVWGNQYWKPHGRVKRDRYGKALSLEDSDYWVFKDARKARKRSTTEGSE